MGRLPKEDPATSIVATIQLLWQSVLRFQHMQRNVPVKLTLNFFYAVCWKGRISLATGGHAQGMGQLAPTWEASSGPIGSELPKDSWNRLSASCMREPVPPSPYRTSIQPAELSSRSTWACRKLKCSPRFHSGEVCLHLQKCARRTQTMQTLLETGQLLKTPRCASGTPTLAMRGRS